jgi:hypothetical protein
MKCVEVEMQRKGLHRKSYSATEIERREFEEAGVPDRAWLTVEHLRWQRTS